MRRVLVAALLAVAAPAAAEERPWLEVRTPSATILTDDSESTARRVAYRVELVRAAFPHFLPTAAGRTLRPLTVFVARDESSVRAVQPTAPAGARSLRVLRAHGDLAVLETAATEDRLDSTVIQLEYREVQRRQELQLPLWLESGLMDFFDATSVREDQVGVGRPDRWRVRGLRRETGLRLRDLFAMDERRLRTLSPQDQGRFASQAWLLVHYLSVGDGGAHRDQLRALHDALARGLDGRAAAGVALGDPDALHKKLQEYARRPSLPFIDLKVTTRVAPEKELVVRRLTETERLAWAAWLQTDAGHARRLAREALARDPGDVRALGVLATSAEETDDRERLALRALEAGSRDLRVRWTLALELSRRTEPEARRRAEELLAGLGTDFPWFAPALARHAELTAQAGDLARAESLARRARSVDPGDPSAHSTLALVLAYQGRVDEAWERLVRAARVARPDVDPRREVVDDAAAEGPLAAKDAHWFDHACDARHAPACFALGTWHSNGGFGAVGATKAAGYFDKGCALGHAPSCERRKAAP